MRKIFQSIWFGLIGAVVALAVYGSLGIPQKASQKNLDNKISQLETRIQKLEEQLEVQKGKVLGAEVAKTECPEFKFKNNRYLKDQGEDIAALQCRLKIDQTRIFDLKTGDALIEFQIKNKIIPSKTAYGAGYFGPRTRTFLNEGRLIPYEEPKKAASSLPTQVEQLPSTESPPVSPPVQKEHATVKIGQLGSFQVELKENDTAFSILLRAGSENGFDVNYIWYEGLGAFINCIGGICGHDNYYWAFYYNDQYSMVGASNQPVKDKDETTWKFETW